MGGSLDVAQHAPHYNHEVDQHESSAAPYVCLRHLQSHHDKVNVFTSYYFHTLFQHLKDCYTASILLQHIFLKKYQKLCVLGKFGGKLAKRDLTEN